MNNNILEIENINKSFPGVKALDNMCFQLKKGEIHALIGENGAGKSTLMKILSGALAPDSGIIRVEQQEHKFRNTREAEQAGIGIVYQELSIFLPISVSENIYINNPPKKNGRIDFKVMYKNVEEMLSKYGLSSIDVKSEVGSLSVGRQQLVEIFRVLDGKVKILILDEPTSALTEKETNILFSIMHQLKKEGVSIIYISHRLNEIFNMCDSVTVMRDGKYIKTLPVVGTTHQELVKMMVGRDVAYNYGAGTSDIRDILLEVKNLNYRHIVKDVSFALKAGEVIGIAGLEGSGRTELLECIFGACRKDSGEILIEGEKVEIDSPACAKGLGMAYMTKNRKSKGLYLDLSVNENIFSANIDKFSKHGVLQYKEAKDNTLSYIKKFDIKTPTIDKTVTQLSGGNQQKVLMSMWMTRTPKILLIDEPTRGIDVGTKESIHILIREGAKAGMGVIIVSSDMPELIGASDRIITMYEGKVSGNLSINEINEENIMTLTAGVI